MGRGILMKVAMWGSKWVWACACHGACAPAQALRVSVPLADVDVIFAINSGTMGAESVAAMALGNAIAVGSFTYYQIYCSLYYGMQLEADCTCRGESISDRKISNEIFHCVVYSSFDN